MKSSVSLGPCAVASMLVAFVVVVAQAQSQQTSPPRRIGFVWLGVPASNVTNVAELREGLRVRGWIEGKNIVIESRYAEGDMKRLAEIAAELVRLPVDVLVTSAVPPTLALKKATQTIPIIVAAETDPAGIVTPGGNVAAFDVLPADAAGRQLGILREVVPGMSRMALVWNGSNPAGQLNARRVREAAQAAGLQVIPLEVQDPGQLDVVLAGLRDRGAQAIFLVSDPLFERKRVSGLTTGPGWPRSAKSGTGPTAAALSRMGPIPAVCSGSLHLTWTGFSRGPVRLTFRSDRHHASSW
jgi:putative ABC transport system substrate-binding protein